MSLTLIICLDPCAENDICTITEHSLYPTKYIYDNQLASISFSVKNAPLLLAVVTAPKTPILGKSWSNKGVNKGEVALVTMIVFYFYIQQSSLISLDQMEIITFYEAQQAELIQSLTAYRIPATYLLPTEFQLLRIPAYSVTMLLLWIVSRNKSGISSFFLVPGDIYEYIHMMIPGQRKIISCLKHWYCINVAITIAKHSLISLENNQVLAQDYNWCHYLHFLHQKGYLKGDVMRTLECIPPTFTADFLIYTTRMAVYFMHHQLLFWFFKRMVPFLYPFAFHQFGFIIAFVF